jgi:IS5 family transposase
LSDAGKEEALREFASMRSFTRLSDLDAISDETTRVHFPRLLETRGLAANMLEVANAHTARRG